MSKTIPIPRNHKITRKNLITALMYYKIIARKQVRLARLYFEKISSLNRQKRLLQAQCSVFYKHRIKELEDSIEQLHEESKSNPTEFAATGQRIVNLAHHVENLLSFHDKCQLLNVSHIAALKELDGDKSVSFEKMIFVHSLEYRGNDDFLPMDDISMPFWNAYQEQFIQEMKINQKLRQAAAEKFDELFPGIHKYQQTVAADGSVTVQRLPPKLKLVSHKNTQSAAN